MLVWWQGLEAQAWEAENGGEREMIGLNTDYSRRLIFERLSHRELSFYAKIQPAKINFIFLHFFLA